MAKTIALADLTLRVNRMLELSDADRGRERLALAILLEGILLDAGVYAGFNYLPSEFAEPGVLREHYDGSRRVYYPPKV